MDDISRLAIQAAIAEQEQAKRDFIIRANIQAASFDETIRVLRELLNGTEPTEPEQPAGDEPNAA